MGTPPGLALIDGSRVGILTALGTLAIAAIGNLQIPLPPPCPTRRCEKNTSLEGWGVGLPALRELAAPSGSCQCSEA